MRWGTFIFYAAFLAIAVVFVVLFIPETKVSVLRRCMYRRLQSRVSLAALPRKDLERSPLLLW